MMHCSNPTTLLLVGLITIAAGTSSAVELPLPVAELERREPVDFASEIAPILKRNCLACHHQKESEGGLILETLAAIQKGGDSGPAVVGGDVESSLLMTRATGSEEPLMPPEDNAVGAVPLTPEELGLLKLWIQQGAAGTDAAASEAIQWQPIPESIRSVYAMDVSPDGRFAAVSRANRVMIVDLATHTEVDQLIDPSLDAPPLQIGPAADVDLIQSIAFSPDGKRIATGGFRTVRIWSQTDHQQELTSEPWTQIAGRVATSSDQSKLAAVNAIGDIEIWDLASRTRLQTLTGHSQRITALQWSPQDARLIVGDAVGEVTVWDPSGANRLAQYQAASAIVDLAAAADGIHLAIATQSHGAQWLRLATTDTGSVIELAAESLGGVTDTNAIAIVSQPAAAVIVASPSAGVLVVDPASGKITRTIDHGAAVLSLAVSADQATLATGGQDGNTRLWSIADGKALATMRGTPQGQLQAATAQRDVERQKAVIAKLTAKTTELETLLKNENEAVVKVTETRDKAAEAKLAEQKKHADAVALVAKTQATIDAAMTVAQQAAEKIATATKANEAAIAMAQQLAAQIEPQQAELEKVRAEVNKTTQQIAELNEQLKQQQASADRLQAELEAKQAAKVKAETEAARAKAEVDMATKAAADAKAMTDTASKELETQQKAATAAEQAAQQAEAELVKRQQALDAATSAKNLAAAAIPAHQQVIASQDRRLSSLDQQWARLQDRLSGAGNAVTGVDFHAAGQLLATVHTDGSTRIYRTVDGQPVTAQQTDQPALLVGVVWIGDVAAGYRNAGQPTLVSSATKWMLKRTIGAIDQPIIGDRVTALDFRRDSLTLAVGSGAPSRTGEVKIFAVETGEIVRDFGDMHSDTVLGLQFSPDGNTLATASADKTIRLLDVASATSLRTLEGHTHHVLSVAWQDDGQTLASASADQTIKVWDTETGQSTRTLTGFPKELTAIRFVQSTTQVVVAGANGQVRLSDTSNGKAVRNFEAAGDFLYSVGVTPDGKKVLSAGQNGVVRIWNLADAKLVHELK